MGNAPLIVFRIIFGIIMFFSLIRFWLKGWIEEFFIQPKFHFHYYGFEWIPQLNDIGIYVIFFISLISSLFIALGFIYRISTLLFFLSYTYLELQDAALYLNHYYLITLIAFLLIFLPAHQRFSLDTKLNLTSHQNKTAAWTIQIIRFQLVILYFYAGLAKVQSDWLFEGQPLKLWLNVHSDVPIIGPYLTMEWTAYIFAWFGCMYDLSIGFFLWNSKTRNWAYFFVLIFHLATGFLFNIGLFPYIMILLTLIFFDDRLHERILKFLGEKEKVFNTTPNSWKKWILIPLGFYCLFQVAIPLRHFFYEGNVLWTEQGYRFSWRVKLVAKNGNATFYIEDRASKRRIEIKNQDYLTPIQEKKMAVKPVFILQFAHHLAEEFQDTIILAGNKQFHLINPKVYAEANVSLNGRASIPLIDPTKDLSKIKAAQIGEIILNKHHPK